MKNLHIVKIKNKKGHIVKVRYSWRSMYINTMKTTFDFNFNIKLSTAYIRIKTKKEAVLFKKLLFDYL